MNKPITLCDRCKEYARCCLNYDGDNCRRIRTVEPTNADRIRSMTDEELAEMMAHGNCGYCKIHDYCFSQKDVDCDEACLDWLRKEVKV